MSIVTAKISATFRQIKGGLERNEKRNIARVIDLLCLR